MGDSTPEVAPKLTLQLRFCTWIRSRKTLQFFVYCSIMVSLGTVISAPGPSLVRLQIQTDSTVAQMAGIFSGRAAGYVIGSCLGGPACDRFDGHRITAFALGVAAVTLGVLPHLRTMWLLGIVTTVQGGAAGFFDTTANVFVLWLFGKDVGPYMQGLHFSFAVGGFITPVLLGILISATDSIVHAWTIIAVLTLFISFAMLALPPAVRSVPDTQNNTGTGGGAWSKNYKKAVGLGFILMFAYVGAEIGTGSFIAAFSIETGLMEEIEAAFLTSVWWFSLALGRGLAIPVSVYLSPKKMVIMNIFGSLAAITVLTLFQKNVDIVYVSIAVFGLFMASTFPSVLATVDQYVALDGKGTSILVASGALGEMLIPLTIGQLLAAIPPSFPFVVLVSMLAFAFFFAVFLKVVRPEKLEHMVLKDEDDESNEDKSFDERGHQALPSQVPAPDLERASSTCSLELVAS